MSQRELTEIAVVGDDDTGLVAGVTSLLFERGINIEDIDQAVQGGLFRMTMRVDASEMETTEDALRADLQQLGDDLGVDVRVRFPADRETRRIAVLVTKESHCLERLCEARENGTLDAELSVVIGNHPDLRPIAEEYGIPFHDVGDEDGNPDEDELLDLLGEYDVDLVVLARYMRILGPNVVFRYEGRIINVHPSLLPAFPGAKAYRQAKEAGVRIAGVTAHYVTTDLDQGPIVAQRAFNVPNGATADGTTTDGTTADGATEGDSGASGAGSREPSVADLKARGQPLEADVLLEAVRLHLDDAVTVHRGRTELREDATGYRLGMPDALERETPNRPTDEGVPEPTPGE